MFKEQTATNDHCCRSHHRGCNDHCGCYHHRGCRVHRGFHKHDEIKLTTAAYIHCLCRKSGSKGPDSSRVAHGKQDYAARGEGAGSLTATLSSDLQLPVSGFGNLEQQQRLRFVPRDSWRAGLRSTRR